MALILQDASANKCFEVDGANVARHFLRSHRIAERDIERSGPRSRCTRPRHSGVHASRRRARPPAWRWTSIAFSEFTEAERGAVVRAHSRSGRFEEEIIQAFYDAIHPRPETTFGNVKADVLAHKDPSFRPENFCRVIRASAWPG
jgi:hypothetical protein